MTDKEFRESIMSIVVDSDVDFKSADQEEVNFKVISFLRKQIRKYRKVWDMLFKMKS